jgi:hypothetical protein
MEPFGHESPPPVQKNTYDEKISENTLEIDEIETDSDGGLMLFNAHLSIVPFRLFTLWKQSSSHLLPLDDDEATNEWSKHLCESVAKAFIESGEMIMIEDEASWVEVGKNQLSRWGLGIIDSASMLENKLKIRLRSDAKYCIPTGILTACLERATAKRVFPKETRFDSGLELVFDLKG